MIQMALDWSSFEGLDLWQVALGGLGFARLERVIELGKGTPTGSVRSPSRRHPTGNGRPPELQHIRIRWRVERFLRRRLAQTPVNSRQVLQVVLLQLGPRLLAELTIPGAQM